MGNLQTKDRGVTPRYIRMWIVERFGQEGLARVLARLSPDAKDMLTKPVPHEWYSVELSRELYEALDAEFTPRNPDALPAVGRFVARRSVKGFLRYLVRLVSVEKIIERISAIWHRYHDGGKIEAGEISEREGRKQGLLTVTDYDAGKEWCTIMAGYIEGMVVSAGARDVTVEKKACIHRGDEVCSWLVSWSP